MVETHETNLPDPTPEDLQDLRSSSPPVAKGTQRAPFLDKNSGNWKIVEKNLAKCEDIHPETNKHPKPSRVENPRLGL